MQRPVVELSECILCELCSQVCPTVFRLTSLGYIEVLDLPSYPQEEVDEVIKHCPADCIHWEEA